MARGTMGPGSVGCGGVLLHSFVVGTWVGYWNERLCHSPAAHGAGGVVEARVVGCAGLGEGVCLVGWNGRGGWAGYV